MFFFQEVFGQKANHSKDLETGFGDAIARPSQGGEQRKRRSPRKHGCRRSTTETPDTDEIMDRKRRSAATFLAPLSRAARQATEFIDYDNVVPNVQNEPSNIFQNVLETCVRIVKRTISFLTNGQQAGGEDAALHRK